VVHRDVKPANVMIGDFGEVYLLDWGIARVGADEPSNDEQIDVFKTTSTRVGALLGTPGYMAPEQLADVSLVDRRSDVYGLGAVLFEILALDPLHSGADAQELCRSTLQGVDARPSMRAHAVDVAPELDAVCVRATELDLQDRFATARELHDAVQSYLDGDRDLELRRALADEHMRRATELVDRVAQGDPKDADFRAAAMRGLGSALALSPASAPAVLATLGRLLGSSPKALPADVRHALERQRLAPMRALLRASAVAYALWLVFMCWTFALGIRSGWLIAAAAAPIVAGCAWMLYQARTPDPHRGVTVQIALCCTSVAASSVVFGPLVLTTLLAVSNLVGLVLAVEPRRRGVVYAGTLISFALPAMLEWLGAGARRYAFTDGVMHILPLAADLPETATRLVLLTSAIAITGATAYFVSHFRDAQLTAEERLQVQMWHFERMFSANPREPTR
jgi:serine/threonine-protein kinase